VRDRTGRYSGDCLEQSLTQDLIRLFGRPGRLLARVSSGAPLLSTPPITYAWLRNKHS